MVAVAEMVSVDYVHKWYEIKKSINLYNYQIPIKMKNK